MSTLVLPDPSLVVLIGAAGSGKSTLAARLFAPDEIVSSDALRAAISGSEADQRASAAAFRALHRTVDRRLAAGAMTVVDATNAKREYRRPLIERAHATGTPVVAIVLDLPPSTIHAQNASSNRPRRRPDRGRPAPRRDPQGHRPGTARHRRLRPPRHAAFADRSHDLRIDRRVRAGTPTQRQGPARPREPTPTPDMRR